MKILFFTDIHQNVENLAKINFNGFDMIICGGDIPDPANPDFDKIKQIVEMIPANTYFVPGNCDNDSRLAALFAKFQNIHLAKTTATIHNIHYDLVGLGYARSLGDDFIEYRRYFAADETRIREFYANSPAKFILQSCGIVLDGDKIRYLPMEECLKKGESFIKKFGSFDENEAADFFGTIDSLQNGIFVTHSPVRGHLDKLPYLPNIGAASAADAVNRLKPALVLCGHFHEYSQVLVDGQTTYFNPGAVKDGKYGIIDFEGSTVSCQICSV